jgi:hypothetical protein
MTTASRDLLNKERADLGRKFIELRLSTTVKVGWGVDLFEHGSSLISQGQLRPISPISGVIGARTA